MTRLMIYFFIYGSFISCLLNGTALAAGPVVIPPTSAVKTPTPAVAPPTPAVKPATPSVSQVPAIPKTPSVSEAPVAGIPVNPVASVGDPLGGTIAPDPLMPDASVFNMSALDPPQTPTVVKRSDSLSFDEDLIEGMNSNPFEALTHLEKQSDRDQGHLYHRKPNFKREIRQTAQEMGYLQ